MQPISFDDVVDKVAAVLEEQSTADASQQALAERARSHQDRIAHLERSVAEGAVSIARAEPGAPSEKTLRSHRTEIAHLQDLVAGCERALKTSALDREVGLKRMVPIEVALIESLSAECWARIAEHRAQFDAWLSERLSILGEHASSASDGSPLVDFVSRHLPRLDGEGGENARDRMIELPGNARAPMQSAAGAQALEDGMRRQGIGS